MVVAKKDLDRIKWQYSTSKVILALIESHEELRRLLRESLKRADFYPNENEIRLECQEAIDK